MRNRNNCFNCGCKFDASRSDQFFAQRGVDTSIIIKEI